MNRTTSALFASFLALLVCSQARGQSAGVVAVGEGDCKKSDRIVIATRTGFTLAEQWRGTFYKDYRVSGELNRYGFKDVRVEGRDGRIYVDDYQASEDRAKVWCFEED